MPSRSVARVFFYACLCAVAVGVGDVQAAELKEKLRELAEMHGFKVDGLASVTSTPARLIDGDPPTQIRILLEDYNYVVFHGEGGEIQRVVISSHKTPPEPTIDELIVKTRRQGAHHIVDARIVGKQDVELPVVLLVDTGASTVVLPDTMIESLGFIPSELEEMSVETANGTVTARMGVLSSVAIGPANARDVSVTFLPSQNGRDIKLLGMSFLDRFVLTLDDANSEIVLIPASSQ